MFNKRWLIAVLLFWLPIVTLGCAQVPANTVSFRPVLDRSDLATVIIDNQEFVACTHNSYRVTTALFEYNNVLALSLEIRNLTNTTLGTAEYFVTLTDGRDLKLIKMLTRQDLITTRAKIAGSASGAIQDQIIQTSIDTVMNTVNAPTKEKMLGIIDLGIAEYFCFRPVFANDRRGGFLCFVPDFRLEYPLIVEVKIKSEIYAFKYLPPKNK